MDNEPNPNAYSPARFQFFHVGILIGRTVQETTVVVRSCPLPVYPRILDLCCGMGRHARALAAQGYQVTGVERDAHAVAIAREQAGGPAYVQADVRDYQPDPATFDAVVIMSQSFGYFDRQPTPVYSESWHGRYGPAAGFYSTCGTRTFSCRAKVSVSLNCRLSACGKSSAYSGFQKS